MGHAGLKLELTSDPGQLQKAREGIEAWIRGIGWAPHDIADMVLAVDEALTNVIRHGYQGATGQPIYVTVDALADRPTGVGVQIRIRDFGRQVPLDKICGRDLEDIRPGGLGVHIIKSVMDFSEYRHISDGGTELVMRRYPRPKQEGDQAKPAGPDPE